MTLTDTDVYVMQIGDVPQLRGWHVPALVVIDATRDPAPSLTALAQIVLVRRRLRAAGGNLVVAASPAVAGLLRSTGLDWAIPCCSDLTAALVAVRQRGRISTQPPQR